MIVKSAMWCDCIQASDFDGAEALGAHLNMLAQNEEAYESYFQWRNDPDEEKRFAEVSNLQRPGCLEEKVLRRFESA